MRARRRWGAGPPLVGLMGLVIVALNGCTDEPEAPADTVDTSIDDVADAVAEDAADAALDVVQGTLQWQRYEPQDPIKMRALVAIPGEPGAYVIVGDKARVWRFGGGAFTDMSPQGIGTSNLHAVWVAPDGRIVVAGAGNSLLIYDGKDWQPAQVNPAQPVTFRAVAGGGDAIWAVGDGAAAWRYKDATWLPEVVTVTDGHGTGLGAAASFVGVAVDSKGGPWIAADQADGAKSVALYRQADLWQGVPLTAAVRDVWVAAGAESDSAGRVFVAGGIGEPLVAIFNGKDAFEAVSSDDLNWKQGFTSVFGVDQDKVWAAGQIGQLRKRKGDTWEVVNVASAFGATPSFSASSDLTDLAVHNDKELAVLSDFTLYRYAVQP